MIGQLTNNLQSPSFDKFILRTVNCNQYQDSPNLHLPNAHLRTNLKTVTLSTQSGILWVKRVKNVIGAVR
jgi:hypothetical protein